MKKKIDRYNEIITKNIFYVTLMFAFWIGVAIVSIFYNIHIGNAQRHKK